MRKTRHVLSLLICLTLLACSRGPAPQPTAWPAALPTGLSTTVPATQAPLSTALPTAAATIAPAATHPQIVPLVPTVGSTPVAQPSPLTTDLYSMLSLDSLLGYMTDLAAIQPYSGWRNSATEGEAQWLDYVAGKLNRMPYLAGIGLQLERQQFHVFIGQEIWEARLYLTIGGKEIEVPANALRGVRDNIGQALRLDSDGQLNDTARNPVTAQGPVLVVKSEAELDALNPADVAGRLVLLDNAVVDRIHLGTGRAATIAGTLAAKQPAGIVLITHFSNDLGDDHGAFVGDLSPVNQANIGPSVPVLYARLEDLASAGIAGWDDLGKVQSARLAWDADVFAPGTSGNLVAHIPGVDPSRAIILSAHIDSPNSPGAMDDGSGSAVLLEVARVLDAAGKQPPVDLYLAWYGSEELGLYGGSYFVATHQEVLDRAVAMLQVDCLTRPLDGVNADLSLVTWSYAQLGNSQIPWPRYLESVAGQHGVEVRSEDLLEIYSDNSPFVSFDVPHADLIYVDEGAMNRVGGVHFAGHIHDPYDTVELARDVSDVLKQMAVVALGAVLEAGQAPNLRITPKPDRRAVFVAGHTEAVHMTPAGFFEMPMTLALAGYDVDMIPYGQEVTPADLSGANLVIVLPVVDYPSVAGDPNAYNVSSWSLQELGALQGYVSSGGLLVITNSANRLKYYNGIQDPNEDWAAMNDLSAVFGVTFEAGMISADVAQVERDHPLVKGVQELELAPGNAVPFHNNEGRVLATADGMRAVVLVDYGGGGGQVLVLGDVGMLGTGGRMQNLAFWRNLAEYAR